MVLLDEPAALRDALQISFGPNVGFLPAPDAPPDFFERAHDALVTLGPDEDAPLESIPTFGRPIVWPTGPVFELDLGA